MSVRLGTTHLTVSSLERSLGFYERVLGLRVQRREDDAVAALGAGGEDLLVLHEEPGAAPAGRHAGLFHFALLYPTRAALARAIRRLAEARWPVDGASDHGVSEAFYLADPDGNGIELYADRPREAWPAPEPGAGRVGMYTRALDVGDLLDTVTGEGIEPQADPGLVMGHMHVHVGDLDAARAFYADGLGLEVMAEYPGALFFAADGYHHHLGTNVWRGTGVAPAPPGRAGLREWTLHGLGEPGVVEDPWGIRLALA